MDNKKLNMKIRTFIVPLVAGFALFNFSFRKIFPANLWMKHIETGVCVSVGTTPSNTGTQVSPPWEYIGYFDNAMCLGPTLKGYSPVTK